MSSGCSGRFPWESSHAGEVTGHFGSLIPGDRPQQRRRQVRHPRFQCVVQCVAVSLRKMQQSDHLGLPFNERADRRARVLTDDEIVLPNAPVGTGPRAGRAVGGS